MSQLCEVLESVGYRLLVNSQKERSAQDKIHAFLPRAAHFLTTTDLTGLKLTKTEENYIALFLANRSSPLSHQFAHRLLPDRSPYLSLAYYYRVSGLGGTFLFNFEGDCHALSGDPFRFKFGVAQQGKSLFLLGFNLVSPPEMDETALGKLEINGTPYAVLGGNFTDALKKTPLKT